LTLPFKSFHTRAAAFVAALFIPLDSVFLSFLGARYPRRAMLEELRAIPYAGFLRSAAPDCRDAKDALNTLGDRTAAVARELTKLHEEIACGSLSELASAFPSVRARGEMVLRAAINRNRADAKSEEDARLLRGCRA